MLLLASAALLGALAPAPQATAVATSGPLPRAAARSYPDPGTLPATVGASVRLVPGAPGAEGFLAHVVTFATGTGFAESFVLHAPTQPPATPAPLVVVFHQFGTTHMDVLQNTEFVQAAFERGWYLVAPLGASKRHLSSIPSQLNTELVLDWVLNQPGFLVDPERIYGVGFSMGGGAALNYAARHKDPTAPRFAAVVNHTGNVSNVNSYADDCVYFACTSQYLYDFWFGDTTPGSAEPWRMARSSVVDYDDLTLQVNLDWALARNLVPDTAVQVRRGGMDTTIPYLAEQTDVFHQTMLDLGAGPGPRYDYMVVPYSTHDWGLLDESATLDWLGQFTLQHPTAGDTLADRDARYHDLDVVLDTQGEFAAVDWLVQPATNSVRVSKTRNLAAATVHLADAGLAPGLPLFVAVGTLDGLGDDVRLTGYPNAPSLVQRDGVATALWTHDPALQTVTLSEPTGGVHVWLVTP